MKKIFLIIMVILFSSFAVGYNLNEIEKAFVDNGEITCYVVVGDGGSSSDVLAQLEIVSYLGKYSASPLIGIGKLVSDVDDLYAQDIISIGNPCVNSFSKEIMDYEGDCVFPSGLSKFYNKNGKTQLVLYGVSDSATRKIASSIANKEFSGEEEVITASAEDLAEIEQAKLLARIAAQKESEEAEPEPELISAEEPEEPEEEPKAVVVLEEKKSLWQKFIDWIKGLFS